MYSNRPKKKTRNSEDKIRHTNVQLNVHVDISYYSLHFNADFLKYFGIYSCVFEFRISKPRRTIV